MDERVGGWMYVWMGGWMDGGWKDGWVETSEVPSNLTLGPSLLNSSLGFSVTSQDWALPMSHSGWPHLLEASS